MTLASRQTHSFQLPCGGENDPHWTHLVGLDTMEVGCKQDAACVSCGQIYTFTKNAGVFTYKPKGDWYFWPPLLQVLFNTREEELDPISQALMDLSDYT